MNHYSQDNQQREVDIEIIKTSMGYLVATEDWQEIVKTKWGIYKLINKYEKFKVPYLG